MAYKLVIQPRAEQDIIEAFSYIQERTPEAAKRWYSRIKSAINSLADMPERCSLAPESEKLGIEIRQFITGKRTGAYRVIFVVREDENQVDILTIRHHSRQYLDVVDIDQE